MNGTVTLCMLPRAVSSESMQTGTIPKQHLFAYTPVTGRQRSKRRVTHTSRIAITSTHKGCAVTNSDSYCAPMESVPRPRSVIIFDPPVVGPSPMGPTTAIPLCEKGSNPSSSHDLAPVIHGGRDLLC
jgi:hypothetical protein